MTRFPHIQLSGPQPSFSVRLARTKADIAAAQRLRYDVFVEELGGTGSGVCHRARREADRFDAVADHLLLCDATRATDDTAGIVGVYRLMRADQAQQVGQFYSEAEYDLAPLRRSGRRLLELGRSCLHRDYRGGTGLMLLWQGVADYVARHEIEILFGVASFHGTDPQRYAHPLSLLAARHLAPQALRVRSLQPQPMNLLPEDRIDRKRAMVETPGLLKAYLRLGGGVGDGAFVDHAFNTIDVCMVMDTARMDATRARLYADGGRT